MVDGRLTSAAVITDLDGTYVAGNTLKIYLRAGVAELLRRLRPDKALAVCLLVVARKLRFISHNTMKYSSIRLIGTGELLLGKVAAEIRRAINPQVEAVVKKHIESGCKVLMATAAPKFYVRLIWGHDLIASPDRGPDSKGIRKRDAVKKWLDAHEATPALFLTDHSDDLPLAQLVASLGGEIVLVNPSPATVKAFDDADIPAVDLTKFCSRGKNS